MPPLNSGLWGGRGWGSLFPGRPLTLSFPDFFYVSLSVSLHCAYIPTPEAIIIKEFHPKEGAGDGAEKVLSSC